MDEGEVLSCTCCGSGVRNTAVENVSYGEEPYPHDTGYGMCRECGGDEIHPTVRGRMGWAMTVFFDARIKVLNEKLNPKNRAGFENLSYVKQCAVIDVLVKEGAMV